MKIEKRLRDFLHLKRTKHNCMFGTVQMSCAYNCICRGEAHIQLYVQLICTVPNIQLFLVLLRCKKITQPLLYKNNENREEVA